MHRQAIASTVDHGRPAPVAEYAVWLDEVRSLIDFGRPAHVLLEGHNLIEEAELLGLRADGYTGSHRVERVLVERVAPTAHRPTDGILDQRGGLDGVGGARRRADTLP